MCWPRAVCRHEASAPDAVGGGRKRRHNAQHEPQAMDTLDCIPRTRSYAGRCCAPSGMGVYAPQRLRTTSPCLARSAAWHCLLGSGVLMPFRWRMLRSVAHRLAASQATSATSKIAIPRGKKVAARAPALASCGLRAGQLTRRRDRGTLGSGQRRCR